MKNSNVVSAVVGSAFFALPYLALAVPLAPALVIGAAAFGASELIFAGTRKFDTLKEKNPRLYNRVEKANKDYSYIYSMIPRINDNDIKKDLKEICDTTVKIINVVVKDPNKEKSITNFFDYYLPVLVKIIAKYDDVENNELVSKESKKFMASSKKMISEVNDSFKKILSSMYQEDLVDADAEMKVFNQMLKSESFNESELSVGRDEENE
ncbi:MAG: 5-bromo-4-chloroindolyl phosphate hydrolysis family protein [Bacilli bacterium]|nr:5-bromo-4-chloroindolyl phosphate hydrolysis family protein [Bacilli bacterium]